MDSTGCVQTPEGTSAGLAGLSGRRPQHNRRISRTRGVAICVSPLTRFCLRLEDYIIYLATSSSGDTRSQAIGPESTFESADCWLWLVACTLQVGAAVPVGTNLLFGQKGVYVSSLLCKTAVPRQSQLRRGSEVVDVSVSAASSQEVLNWSCSHSKLSNSGSSIVALGSLPPKQTSQSARSCKSSA